MLEPKLFYRKFDTLLKKIDIKEADENFPISILREFNKRFRDELHILSIRIYEENNDEFVLINPLDRTKTTRAVLRIPVSSVAVQRVLERRCYLSNNLDFFFSKEASLDDRIDAQAAFTVRSQRKQWIVAFGLKEGWVREELLFCINAMRTALNYRLLSESIANENEQTAQIQLSLLPREIPLVKGLQIAGRSQPARFVGGDLFDYFQFADGKFGVSIGDASGHGLPAALLVRDLVTGLRMGLAQQRKMVNTIKTLNQVIYRSTYSTRFISLFYGEISKNGNFNYVNAGHPPPLLVTNDKVRELKTTGTIVGALPEISLKSSKTKLENQAVLLLYTDGIFERKDSRAGFFGIERLKELLKRNKNKNAQKILESIFEASFEFAKEANWEDDATVVVVKRTSD